MHRAINYAMPYSDKLCLGGESVFEMDVYSNYLYAFEYETLAVDTSSPASSTMETPKR
jgi:hypothetical protein